MKKLSNKQLAGAMYTELSLQGRSGDDILGLAKESKGWAYRFLEKICVNEIEKERKNQERQKLLENLSSSEKRILSDYEELKLTCKATGNSRRRILKAFRLKHAEIFNIINN